MIADVIFLEVTMEFSNPFKKLTKFEMGLWICSVVVIIVSFFASNGGDVLTLIASLLFVLCIAQNTTKYYRLLYIGNCLIWIPYDILAGAWGNFFTHTVLTIAIFVSIIMNDRKKKKAY